MAEAHQGSDLRWWALLAAILACVWGSWLGVRPLLAYGVAQLGVLALLWAYPRLALRQLSVARELAPRACEEDQVTVTFQVVHRSRLPLFAPTVEDWFSPDGGTRRRTLLHPALPGRHSIGASYRGTCFSRRGEYALGPAAVEASCPLGLFAARRVEPAPGRLLVLPAIEELLAPPGDAYPARFPGGGRLRRGAGERTLSVREHRPGEPLRHLHAPSSARRGRLMVRELELPQAQRMTLLLDLSQASLRGLGRQATLEVAVRAAAAIGAASLRRGDLVALTGLGAEPVHVPPGGGLAQLGRLLEVLARVRPNGTRPLSEVLPEVTPGLRAGDVLTVVIADLADGEALVPSVAALRARSCGVVAVLLDPASFLRLSGDAAREAGVHGLASRLLAVDASVHCVRADGSLAEALAVPYAGRPRVRLAPEALA